MMNNEILQLKTELRKRSRDYLERKGNTHAQAEGVENAIDHVFSEVIMLFGSRHI